MAHARVPSGGFGFGRGVGALVLVPFVLLPSRPSPRRIGTRGRTRKACTPSCPERSPYRSVSEAAKGERVKMRRERGRECRDEEESVSVGGIVDRSREATRAPPSLAISRCPRGSSPRGGRCPGAGREGGGREGAGEGRVGQRCAICGERGVLSIRRDAARGKKKKNPSTVRNRVEPGPR